MNAIIFDFDGTIADSFDQVLQFLCTQAGREPTSFTEVEIEKLRGLSMRELAVEVGVPTWKLPLVYWRGKKFFAKNVHTMQAFAGMSDALAQLHREKYKLYIISSNNRRNINRFITQHGLSNYFVKVYGNAGWFGKSSILKKTVRRHRLNAASTIYVGDEVRDIVAAKMAGMPSVAVAWGFGSEEQLLKYGPTVLVRTPEELKKTLVEWGNTN